MSKQALMEELAKLEVRRSEIVEQLSMMCESCPEADCEFCPCAEWEEDGVSFCYDEDGLVYYFNEDTEEWIPYEEEYDNSVEVYEDEHGFLCYDDEDGTTYYWCDECEDWVADESE